MFDSFLQSREIEDPYKDCALPAKRKASGYSRVEALTLHIARKIDFTDIPTTTSEEDSIQVERVEETIDDIMVFGELRATQNKAVIIENN